VSALLTEEQCGLKVGSEFKFKRHPIDKVHSHDSEAWFFITGNNCAPIIFQFDRAAHNTHDGLYAYCFKSPSGEEFWVEFSENIELEVRLEKLRSLFSW